MTPVTGIRSSYRTLQEWGLPGVVYFDMTPSLIKAAYAAHAVEGNGRGDKLLRTALGLEDIAAMRVGDTAPEGFSWNDKYVFIGTNGTAYHSPAVPLADGTIDVKLNRPLDPNSSNGYGKLAIGLLLSGDIDPLEVQKQVLELIAGRFKDAGLMPSISQRNGFPPGYISPGH